MGMLDGRSEDLSWEDSRNFGKVGDGVRRGGGILKRRMGLEDG